jgi:hypothetical protein
VPTRRDCGLLAAVTFIFQQWPNGRRWIWVCDAPRRVGSHAGSASQMAHWSFSSHLRCHVDFLALPVCVLDLSQRGVHAGPSAHPQRNVCDGC